jgi:hypothetical protein
MRRRFRAILALSITPVLAVLVETARVRSEPKPPAPGEVGVAFPRCTREPFSFDAAMAALETELGQEGVKRVVRLKAAGRATGAWIEITVDCGQEASSLVIRIHDPQVSGVSRTMELTDLPAPLRPRGLALAAAELARSVWSRPPSASFRELDAALPEPNESPSTVPSAPPPAPSLNPAASATVNHPAPEPHPGSAPTSAPLPPRASVVPPGPEWLASGGVRFFYPDSTALGGVRAGVRFRRVRGGLEGFIGPRGDVLGTVTLGSVAGWLGVDAIRHQSARSRVRAGPRAALGLAMASTTQAEAREPYLDLAGEFAVEVRQSEKLSICLELETGVARGLAVTADGRRAGTIGGWLLGGRLGVAFLP